MKKRRNKFFDIRVQFFFICMAGFIGVALLAALAAWGLEHLGVNVPMFVWLLIFTLLLGSAGALFAMRVFHHKTRHWYFKFGIPAILLAQIALGVFVYVRFFAA